MDIEKRQTALQNKTIFISCIVPAYNEEKIIESFVIALQAKLSELTQQFEIIIVDDGSEDQTSQKIFNLSQNYPVKLLRLSRNFGKEVALTAGLQHCSGEVAILIDADFQHPPETIPSFLIHWAAGYDMVYGIRDDRSSDTYFKRHFAKIFYWMMKKITRIDIQNNVGDFRLMDRKIIDVFKSFPERTRFMKGLYAWVGFKKKGVLFHVHHRKAGQSTWQFSKLAELAITGITSFSDIPLRIWGVVGFIISFISLVYAIYMVTTTLLYGTDLPGFPSLIVAIMFLGGIQLLSIGILGEYIARIFTEVKQRPQYLLEIKYGFDE